VLYTPERDFAGTDVFSYRIADAGGGESSANVKITVTDVAEVADPVLTLQIAPASIAENAGDVATTGVLSLSVAAREAITVNVSAENPQRITVPAQVIIPAGATQASFTIGVVDDRIYTGNWLASIQAAIPNSAPSLATITVIDNERAADFLPRIAWLTPRPSFLSTLTAMEGTVAGSVAEGTTGLKVWVAIQRFDGAYYNGRAWGALQWLPATVSAGRWKLPVNLLPPAAALRNGRYNLIARADLPNGSNRAYVSVIIDRTAPQVTILTPAHRSTVSALTTVAGQASDPLAGSGVTRVLLAIRRLQDNRYWSGRSWGTLPVALSNPVSAGRWTRSTALPAGLNLRAGYYQLTATAIDRAGNRTSVTSVVIVALRNTAPATTRQDANEDARSRVALSSSTVDAAANRIVLSWTGALDTNSATDADVFSVEIDGKPALIEEIIYKASEQRVILQLGEESTSYGSVINVTWRNLKDAQQQLIAEGSTTLSPR
jgi:hypothetical protein